MVTDGYTSPQENPPQPKRLLDATSSESPLSIESTETNGEYSASPEGIKDRTRQITMTFNANLRQVRERAGDKIGEDLIDGLLFGFLEMERLVDRVLLKNAALLAQKEQSETLLRCWREEERLDASPKSVARMVLQDEKFLGEIQKRVATGALTSALAIVDQDIEETREAFAKTLAEKDKIIKELEVAMRTAHVVTAATGGKTDVAMASDDHRVEPGSSKTVPSKAPDISSIPKVMLKNAEPAPMPLRRKGQELVRGRIMDMEMEDEGFFAAARKRDGGQKKKKKKKKKVNLEAVESGQEARTEGAVGADQKPTPKPTYSEMLRRVASRSADRHDGPVYVTIGGSDATWNPSSIWKDLPSKEQLDGIGSGVEVVRATRAGTVLLKAAGVEQASKLIEWQALKEKGLKACLAKAKRPRLEIKGVPKDWDAPMVEKVLWEKIEEGVGMRPGEAQRREWMRACFSKPMRGGLKNVWIAEVQPVVRTAIMNLREITGGWWNLLVRDYLDAPICLNCYEFGHIRAKCSSGMVCRWCGKEGHKAVECQAKKEGSPPECRSCVAVGTVEGSRRHVAGSRECPVHMREVEKLVKRTRYA